MWMSRTRRTAAFMVAAILLSACGGGGGDSNPAPVSNAPPIAVVPEPVKKDPIPVLKSSFENKAVAGKALGSVNMPAEVNLSNTVAFADFFQDGTYSMVTHSLIYNRDDPKTAGMIGAVRFYKNVNGAWVDNTSKLLSDTAGCIHPRKAVVADFNGDSKPDVFIACHGFDAPPYVGEKQHMLLSQSDGTYKNTTVPFTCYCHGASAADVNGDNFADILVTDNQANETVPFFLMNDKNGGFVKDFSRLPFQPKVWSSPNITYTMNVSFTAELIDFDSKGHYDAFLAGTEAPDDEAGIPPTIFKNDGKGDFKNKETIITFGTNAKYSTTLDIAYAWPYVYLNRVETKGGLYGFSAIEKIDLRDHKVANTIYTNSNNFANGSTWLNWIMLYQDKVVSQNAVFNVSVKQ